jgi:DNA-binding NarL/FixJ family response regulator
MTRVLIVDDQPSFRRQLGALLRHAGFDAIGEANDIPEGEAALRAMPFDLAIVDVMLPGINGVEGVPRLKEITPGLRVVLVSAHRDYADVLQKAAKQVNAEAFIPKDDLDLALVASWKEASASRS